MVCSQSKFCCILAQGHNMCINYEEVIGADLQLITVSAVSIFPTIILSSKDTTLLQDLNGPSTRFFNLHCYLPNKWPGAELIAKRPLVAASLPSANEQVKQFRNLDLWPINAQYGRSTGDGTKATLIPKRYQVLLQTIESRQQQQQRRRTAMKKSNGGKNNRLWKKENDCKQYGTTATNKNRRKKTATKNMTALIAAAPLGLDCR